MTPGGSTTGPQSPDGDLADGDGWSALADGWAELWGTVAAPAWDVVVRTCRIGPGVRVLDVGCGSGDLLAHVAGLGAVPAGADPAPGMVRVARARVPAADVRLAAAHHLPWPDASVDVVTAVDVVHLVDESARAVREMARVVVPGGRVALVGWAERHRNDLDAVDAALARTAGEDAAGEDTAGADAAGEDAAGQDAAGEDPARDDPARGDPVGDHPSADHPSADDDLRVAGGLERLLREAGLDVVEAGLVPAPWTPPDDDALVRGVLLGEDAAGLAEAAPTVLAAARPFRNASGAYRLVGSLRYAVARCRPTSRRPTSR